MKGDFTRSTFDARKHYSGVRMQQGRVQIDADWNEQCDIVRHDIEAQLRDLVGLGGIPAAQPGFTLSVGERPGATGDPPTPDLLIAPGRYYLDGIVCESDAPTSLAEQPDYPGGALLPAAADGDSYLVYLDVWQRHVTFIEDPDLREIALDGPDTATRTKTIWQMKLLPLDHSEAADPPADAPTPLAELAAWQAFIGQSAKKAQLQARRLARAQLPQNQLYRVEIHSVDSSGASFKWSRENGSVAFPITGLSIASSTSSSAPPAEAVQATPAPVPTQLDVTLEYLERDKLYLRAGDWVEIEGDESVLKGQALPLCRVKELDLVEGQDDQLGQVQGHVSLEAGEAFMAALRATWPQPINSTTARASHLLLRRWDQGEPPSAPGSSATPATPDQAQASVWQVQPEHWQTLEYGIEICFTHDGSYAVGDYWLIPSRSQQQSPAWPARPPDGIIHHYAPLARLDRRAGAWEIAPGEPLLFETLTELTAQSKCQQREIAALRAALQQLEASLAAIQTELEELRKAAAISRTRLSLDFRSEADLEIGDVVALDPSMNDHVVRVNRDNEALIVGVVTGNAAGEHQHKKHYRVAVYGRANCRVIGDARPGDLLVAAKAAGCARRAGRYIRPGTIIGKALEHHNSQRVGEIGVIEILITLG